MNDENTPFSSEEEKMSPAVAGASMSDMLKEPDSNGDAPSDFSESSETAIPDAESETEENSSRIKKRWLQFLLIWAAVLVVIGAVTCFILYRYAAVYEVTRSELPMEQLMDSMSKDDWLDQAAPTASAYITEFEDAEALFRNYYNTFLRENDLTYRTSLAATDELTSTFVVMARNTDLYKVVFKARTDKHAGFGRHYWALDSISVCDFTSHLDSITIEIDLPENVSAFVNSVPVGEAYFSGNIDCPNVTALEMRFDSPPHYKSYRITPLYGEVIVTDDSGNELYPEFDESTRTYSYSYESPLYAFSVEAPEDVTVKICGAALTAEEETGRKLGIFEGFQNYSAGNEWYTVEYNLSGLYTEPVITAFDSLGNELTPIINDGGKFIFYHASDPQTESEMRSLAEKFFNSYMDYSSSALSNAKLFNLLGYTLFGTRLNRYFRESAEGMYWASKTEIEYDELKFSDFYPAGDNCFFCTVQYDANFTAQSWYENYSYGMKDGYELLFIKEGYRWFAGEMSAFS